MSACSLSRLEVGPAAAVTQATDITTGVSINAVSGQIVTVTTTLAAAAEASFVVTNNRVGPTSIIIAHLAVTASAGTPAVWVTRVAAGTFTLMVANLDASAALDNALVIHFAILNPARQP